MARRSIPQHWMEVMAPRGLTSIRRLAERAGLSHTAVNDVVHGDAKNPAHETLAGIARALELPLADVYALSGQQRPNAEQWAPPAEANLLTARQRRAIEDLIRSIVLTSAEERGGHGEAAPMNMAGGDPAGEQQDPHAASAVGDEVPEVERGTDAPGPAANAERMQQRTVSAWTGKVPPPEGPSGSRAPVSAGRAGRSGSEEGAEGGEQPSAEFFYGLAADDRRTEGMAQRDAIDAAGEESQIPDDDEERGA